MDIPLYSIHGLELCRTSCIRLVVEKKNGKNKRWGKLKMESELIFIYFNMYNIFLFLVTNIALIFSSSPRLKIP